METQDLEPNPDGVASAAPEPAPADPPRVENGLLRAMAAGALGGIVGTTAMTLGVAAAQKVGLLGKMPPKKITRAMLHALDVHPDRRTTNVLSGIAHYGFGATMGALFGAVHQRTRDLAPAPLQGTAFGFLVWAAAYVVAIPALGIMPPPSLDRPGRPSSMIVGHLIYGATLGAVVGASLSLARRRADDAASPGVGDHTATNPA